MLFINYLKSVEINQELTTFSKLYLFLTLNHAKPCDNLLDFTSVLEGIWVNRVNEKQTNGLRWY